MHTWVGDNSEHPECHGLRMQYNSDMSGDVIIAGDDRAEMTVPARALLEFVAEWVIRERIGWLEQQDALGVLLRGHHA